jgi:cytochrome b561
MLAVAVPSSASSAWNTSKGAAPEPRPDAEKVFSHAAGPVQREPLQQQPLRHSLANRPEHRHEDHPALACRHHAHQHHTATTADTDHAERYSRAARVLHWLMAIGFALMWATGVLATNVEGVPFFTTEDDLQGAIRDLHKSIGLTLLGLLVLRAGLRVLVPPPLPAAIPAHEQRRAHLGHLAIYATVVVACITGLAIADVQEYGNAYFGIELPQLFPTTERILGWSVNPWIYVLHAIFAYGLLALIVGHVLFVAVHRNQHGVALLNRMLALRRLRDDVALKRLVRAAVAFAAVIALLATVAFVTLGPTEEARDYLRTTPFSR